MEQGGSVQSKQSHEAALIEISAAEAALQRAADIQDMLDLRDTAMAYGILSNARGFQEAAQKAKIFQLRAERKAGDWLKEHGPKTGQRADLSQDGTGLADLGIDRHESSRWQLQAELPEERFNEYVDDCLATGREISAAGLRRAAREYQREQRQEEDELAAQDIASKDGLWELIESDFRTASVEAGSIHAVITDPPYPEEYLDLYEDIGSFAEHVLKPGGSLLAMVGQAHLGDVIEALGAYLTYQWTLAMMLPGPKAQMYQRKVSVGWKPVLWFVKGKYSGQSISDYISNDRPDKGRFNWQQGLGGFVKLIEDFTRPGEMVADPLCGTGTTGVAAIGLGRRFVGIDNDPSRIASAKVRLSAAGKGAGS